MKWLVLQHKRRTSAVSGTKKWHCHALAPALAHRPRSHKKNGAAEPLCYGNFYAFGHFWGRKMTKNLEKARFAKVHAGARLSRPKKLNPLRPRARLGASTAITKKTARATVMRTMGVFMAIFFDE